MWALLCATLKFKIFFIPKDQKRNTNIEYEYVYAAVAGVLCMTVALWIFGIFCPFIFLSTFFNHLLLENFLFYSKFVVFSFTGIKKKKKMKPFWCISNLIGSKYRTHAPTEWEMGNGKRDYIRIMFVSNFSSFVIKLIYLVWHIFLFF